MSNEHKEFTFLDTVDTATHDSIVRLNQKLKGLQAEINAKIDVLASVTDANSLERKKQLLVLADEVKKALDTIHNLVNLVIEDDLSPSQFNELNQKNIESLKEIFQDSADKISVIKEKF